MRNFIFIIVVLVSHSPDIDSQSVKCNVGYPGSIDTQSNCVACMTTTINSVVTFNCSSTQCTPSTGVTCCNADLCNNSTGSTTGSSAGLRCYDDLAGKSGTIKSNCAQCMRIATNLFVTTLVQQMCSPYCVPFQAALTNTTCCTTDLCNGVTGVTFGSSGVTTTHILAGIAIAIHFHTR